MLTSFWDVYFVLRCWLRFKMLTSFWDVDFVLRTTCNVRQKVSYVKILRNIWKYLLSEDKIWNWPWRCCLLAFYVLTPGPAVIRTVCKYSRRFLSRISHLSSCVFLRICCSIYLQILGDYTSKYLVTKKHILQSENEPKQCINTWQFTEVSDFKKRHADNSGNHVDLRRTEICHNKI